MDTNTTFTCSTRLAALDEQYSFVSRQFSNSFNNLYKFLGECHALVNDIGSDGSRVTSLNDALERTSTITDRERKLAKTVSAKVVLYVFRKEDGDLSNRSTRSNYKRAIQKAVDNNLSSVEFIQKLQDGGIIAFISGDKKKSLEEAADRVAAKRKKLLTTTIPSMSTINLIDNRNPADTFAVVIYRVDNGLLVPCLATDHSTVVDKLLSSLIPIDEAQLIKEAKEHGERETIRYLNEKKAA